VRRQQKNLDICEYRGDTVERHYYLNAMQEEDIFGVILVIRQKY